MSLIVFGHPVELIGYEGKTNAIGSIEVPQRLEQRASETSMTRRVCRERRSEIRPGEIACRRAEW
jgi:hypothetical protein